MPSVSTHVLDGAGGGGRARVAVELRDTTGGVVGAGITDVDGRLAPVASGLASGRYTLTWFLGGAFVEEVTVAVALTDERHYHIPLLSSPTSAVTYLGV